VYYGDGGLLSNIRTDFGSVIVEGNTTSNVVEFMNATTAFITDLTSNVVMNVNQLNNVTITTGSLVDQQILRYNAGTGQWINDSQTLAKVVDTGNVTSNVVQFTNATTGLVATSNVQAGAFYGEGSTLSFTSNVFIEEGLVVNKNSVANKQYAYTGSMTYSNVGVTFSTNVFSAKITAHLVHDDDEVSTMQIECCGGSKNGTSTHNIVAGKVNKFGVTTSYPWKHEVTTTPTQVIWEPEQTGSTNYDYDIHVELLSSHPSAGVTQITEAGSAVKYFSH
jgi:hypothetical protein